MRSTRRPEDRGSRVPVWPILVFFGSRRFTRETALALVMPGGLSSRRPPDRGLSVIVRTRDRGRLPGFLEALPWLRRGGAASCIRRRAYDRLRRSGALSLRRRRSQSGGSPLFLAVPHAGGQP